MTETKDPPKPIIEALERLDQTYRRIEHLLFQRLTDSPENRKVIKDAFQLFFDFEFKDYLHMKKHRQRIMRYIEREGLREIEVSSIGAMLRLRLPRQSFPFRSIVQTFYGQMRTFKDYLAMHMSPDDKKREKDKDLYEAVDTLIEWLETFLVLLQQRALRMEEM